MPGVSGISRADITDADFIDAVELGSDGTTVNVTVNVTSTTSGTQTVVVALAADGEGILHGRDHLVEAGDLVTLAGTSGGLADGTYTVLTVPSDTSFTVAAIVTSTGGTATFKYTAGATHVGIDPLKQNVSASNVLQQAYTDVANSFLLDNEPNGVGVTYVPTRVAGKVTQEVWSNTANSRNIRSVIYTYTGAVVTTEVTKVFAAADGTTILAQKTTTYAYSGNLVTGSTTVRNV